MSVQILLHGKLFGIQDFLLSQTAQSEKATAGENEENLLTGRCHWAALIAEILPRSVLAELGLAKILLGTSGGSQFLIVLPSEAREAAETLLEGAAGQIGEITGGTVRLIWSVTENLGDWVDVRKRLNEEIRRKQGTPAARVGVGLFEPFTPPEPPATDGYFSEQMGVRLRSETLVGWSPEKPGMVLPGEGKHTWPITQQPSADSIPFARHSAPADEGSGPASLRALASRAEGHRAWGVLIGDVDNFLPRIRRAQNIEEHVRLSILYKQFFAGELAVLCSLPDYWRKVTILHSGGNDFAVYGSWDALPDLAREVQRLFHRFSEENLKEFPGPEGKTISMAMALAPRRDATLADVYAEASLDLQLAKSADKDCIHILGRILEWKQLADASELKDSLVKMAREYGSSRQFFFDLSGVYRKASALHSDATGVPGEDYRFDRPWRFHRRIHRVFGGMREREFQKLRTHLIHEMSGRGSAQIRLRPAGRVALEWARLGTEV